MWIRNQLQSMLQWLCGGCASAMGDCLWFVGGGPQLGLLQYVVEHQSMDVRPNTKVVLVDQCFDDLCSACVEWVPEWRKVFEPLQYQSACDVDADSYLGWCRQPDDDDDDVFDKYYVCDWIRRFKKLSPQCLIQQSCTACSDDLVLPSFWQVDSWGKWHS